jgi:hypothetical protein
MMAFFLERSKAKREREPFKFERPLETTVQSNLAITILSTVLSSISISITAKTRARRFESFLASGCHKGYEQWASGGGPAGECQLRLSVCLRRKNNSI